MLKSQNKRTPVSAVSASLLFIFLTGNVSSAYAAACSVDVKGGISAFTSSCAKIGGKSQRSGDDISCREGRKLVTCDVVIVKDQLGRVLRKKIGHCELNLAYRKSVKTCVGPVVGSNDSGNPGGGPNGGNGGGGNPNGGNGGGGGSNPPGNCSSGPCGGGDGNGNGNGGGANGDGFPTGGGSTPPSGPPSASGQL